PVAAFHHARLALFKCDAVSHTCTISLERTTSGLLQDGLVVLTAETFHFLGIAANVRPMPFKSNLRVAGEVLQNIIVVPFWHRFDEQVLRRMVNVPDLP